MRISSQLLLTFLLTLPLAALAQPRGKRPRPPVVPGTAPVEAAKAEEPEPEPEPELGPLHDFVVEPGSQPERPPTPVESALEPEEEEDTGTGHDGYVEVGQDPSEPPVQ